MAMAMAMAALSIGYSSSSSSSSCLQIVPIQGLKSRKCCSSRIVILCCERGKMEKKEKKEEKQLIDVVVRQMEKLGKGLKDSLSPKQKGDWKDLVLMSLSFAVYVYISQQLVCAYCTWNNSFLNHSW